jgi:hypothetical protein
MPSLLQLAFGAASAAVASAHMCTYEPLQRGGVEGSGTAGAGVCALTDGPCPSETNAGPASQAYFSGDEIYVSARSSRRWRWRLRCSRGSQGSARLRRTFSRADPRSAAARAPAR